MIEFYPESNSNFFNDEKELAVSFIKNKNNEVIGLILNQEGNIAKAVKVKN